MAVNERIDDLLVRWEELRDLGCPVSAEELCRETPELLHEVRQRVAVLESMDRRLGAEGAETVTMAGRQTPGTRTVDSAVGPGHAGSQPAAPPGYEIIEILGQGGMGVVYKARQIQLARVVALKMIRAGGLVSDSDRVRFFHEAQAIARLSHPHIVQVHEVGEIDRQPFFALEYCEGGSLADQLAKNPLPAADAASIVKKLAGAVQAAHAQGIIHRDLKPANVLLATLTLGSADDGAESQKTPAARTVQLFIPKISDFGLAKKLEEAGQTQSGAILGTPSYMAPEQAQGKTTELGPAADIYALGAILYECLTGRPPFRAATIMDTLWQVIHQDPVSPRQLQPKTPRDLETICLKCLQKDPGRRYTTAAALAEDLRRFSTGEPIKARAVGRMERTVRWARRKPSQAGLVVTMIAAVVAGLWYVNDLTYRSAERDTRAKQVNREVLAAVAEAETQLDVLRAQVDDPLRVHELLSRIQDWKAMVDRAEQSHRRALGVIKGQEGLLETEAVLRLQTCTSRVEAEQSNYGVAKELDLIRLDSVKLVEGKRKRWNAGSKYAAFFRTLNIDMDATEAGQVPDLVLQSPVRFALVAACDHWVEVSTLQGAADRQRIPQLLSIARHADPDRWRHQFRSETTWANVAKLKELAATVEMARQSPQIVFFLALLLKSHGEDASSLLRSAVLAYPSDFWLHLALANDVAPPSERAAHYLAALSVRPDCSVAYDSLGIAYYDQKKLPDAIAAWRKAIDFDPKYANAYNNLGVAFAFRKQLPDAIAAFQQAVHLDPTYAGAYGNLGKALYDQKKLPEAIAAYKSAIALNSNNAELHTNLGVALRGQQKWHEAVLAYKKAIDLDPKYPNGHAALGQVLLDLGSFADAVQAFQCALDLVPAGHPMHGPLNKYLEQANRLLKLERRLPSILNGMESATANELLQLAGMCQRYQARHASAVWLYQQAFLLQPSHADNPNIQHRYLAACAAALAGSDAAMPHVSGDAIELAKLTDADKAKYRRQAFDWLSADFDAYRKQLLAGNLATTIRVADRLSYWQQDVALAKLRDDKSLDRLPPDELKAWSKLWGDVQKVVQDIYSRFTTTDLDGSLTVQQPSKVLDFRTTAGRALVIDMESKEFDTLLRLESAESRKVAENDDIEDGKDLNSRIIYTPTNDGMYRIIATSYQQRGIGVYKLRIRESRTATANP